MAKEKPINVIQFIYEWALKRLKTTGHLRGETPDMYKKNVNNKYSDDDITKGKFNASKFTKSTLARAQNNSPDKTKELVHSEQNVRYSSPKTPIKDQDESSIEYCHKLMSTTPSQKMNPYNNFQVPYQHPSIRETNINSIFATDSDCPDQRPKSVNARIRRPMSEESIQLNDSRVYLGRTKANKNDDTDLRSLIVEADKQLFIQKMHLENLGVKDELELIWRKAFNAYDANFDGYIGFENVKKMFSDAKTELNSEILNESVLLEVWNKVEKNENGMVDFDTLFAVIGPVLEQHIDDNN